MQCVRARVPYQSFHCVRTQTFQLYWQTSKHMTIRRSILLLKLQPSFSDLYSTRHYRRLSSRGVMRFSRAARHVTVRNTVSGNNVASSTWSCNRTERQLSISFLIIPPAVPFSLNIRKSGPDYPMCTVCTRTGGPTTVEAPPQGKRENCH